MFGNVFGSVGGAVLGKAVDTLFGERNIRKGNQADFRTYKQRDMYDWEQAQSRGLTPQEFYGSAAAGSSASQGSAQVLGNATDKTNIMESVNRQKDREVQMRAQDKQLEGQKYAADAAAGATTEAATITQTGQVAISRLRNLLEERKVNIMERQFEEIALDAAAANLALTKAQVEKAVNEIATSAPSFVKEKILLQMGFENTVQNMVLKRAGVDPTSETSMQSLSDEKYRKLLLAMLGNSSTVGKELRGLATTSQQVVEFLYKFGKEFSSHVIPSGAPTLGSGPPGK